MQAKTNTYFFILMANTHLTFYQPCCCGNCEAPRQLIIVLTGTLELSPYVEVNGQSFTLSASYTHSDGDVDNVYYPLFSTHADRH
ncbi:hypothetical protein GCM10027190_00850 [Spirosoma areae]